MARAFSGRLLRQHRERAGLRCENVAVEVGRSVQAIWSYEREVVSPQVAILARLADLLGVTVEDFFEDRDPEVAA